MPKPSSAFYYGGVSLDCSVSNDWAHILVPDLHVKKALMSSWTYFLGCHTSQYTMLPRPTNDDLYLREANVLKPYFQLYKNWGYRDGPHGHHTKFELKSLESRWFQNFTDPLFRNLQQLDVQSATRMRR
jgi:hypothetical protein